MAETVQKKFFALLDERAEKSKMEVVVSYNYANTGTLHLQKLNGFETYASVPFSFQSGSTSFGSSGKGSPEFFPLRPNPRFALFQADQLDEALTAIVAFAILTRAQKGV